MPRGKKKVTDIQKSPLNFSEYVDSISYDPWVLNGVAILLSDKSLIQVPEIDELSNMQDSNNIIDELLNTQDTDNRVKIAKIVIKYVWEKIYHIFGEKYLFGTAAFFISIKFNSKTNVLPNVNVSFTKKPDICDICSTFEPVTDAKKYLYPNIISVDKSANFYSNAKQSIKLCPRCAVAGFVTFSRWIYYIIRDKSKNQSKKSNSEQVYLFQFHSDLKELINLYRVFIIPTQKEILDHENAQKILAFRNFNFKLYTLRNNKNLVPDNLGVYEVLFDLLLQIFETHAIYKSSIPSLDVHMISAHKNNNSLLIKQKSSIQIKPVYKFYKFFTKALVTEESSIDSSDAVRSIKILRNIFENNFVFFDGEELDSSYRNAICERIINKKDITDIVMNYMYNVAIEDTKELTPSAIDMIKIYTYFITNIDLKLMTSIEKYATQLGRLISERNKKNLLYQLRNCTTLNQMLNLFIRTQQDLGIYLDNNLVHGIIFGFSKQWDVIKRLICIYAVNSYIFYQLIQSDAKTAKL